MPNESEGRDQEIIARLEQWRKTPVYFASGSEKKKLALSQSGIFDVVHLLTTPLADEQERIDRQNFLNEYQDHILALFKTEAPMAVAEGKLKNLIKHHEIPKDAFLLAADTMPQFFPEADENGKFFDKIVEAISMDRPKSIENAKQQMIYVFKSIARDYVEFRGLLEAQRQAMAARNSPEKKIEQTLMVMQWGRLGSCVKINTGIAIRFPQSETIETFSEEVNMYPQFVYDLVDNNTSGSDDAEIIVGSIESQLQNKVEEIINLQKEKTLNISGGIDYSDPKVRSCLGARIMRHLQLIPDDQIDPEWFQGLPTKALKEYLYASAINKR